jgi:geranylgeranyl diphosphate synthase type II
MIDLPQYLKEHKATIDEALASYLPKPGSRPSLLHRAIHYSLFAGGKRLRPILTLAAFEAVGGKSDDALPVASAIELIHTYSLVHDDLPAMDNDDWRRGHPTSHKMFGESTAILVGDALLTAAFALLADRRRNRKFPADVMLKVIHELGQAAGSRGMVGGQLMDVQSCGKSVDERILHYIHTHKTAALIRASVRVGGLLGGAKARALSALTLYGEKVGLAFQIADDILDVEGSEDEMGKRLGKDRVIRKVTYPGVIGLRRAKAYANRLSKDAVAALDLFDENADPLKAIARYIVERNH